jgi:hypothetical protein
VRSSSKTAEVRERDGAGERVPGVGVSVEERLEVLVRREERVEDGVGREGRGQRKVAARQSLRGAEQIRA